LNACLNRWPNRGGGNACGKKHIGKKEQVIGEALTVLPRGWRGEKGGGGTQKSPLYTAAHRVA